MSHTPSNNVYIYQHNHDLTLCIKGRKFGNSRKYLAEQYTLIDTIESKSAERYNSLREAINNTFGINTTRITASKANCDKIDTILSNHYGFDQPISTFAKVKKFEKVWPQSVKVAAKSLVLEENQHRQIYPLYLHKVRSMDYTRTNVNVRLWLSREVLKHAVDYHEDFDNTKESDMTSKSKVIAVYMFHSVADREAAMKRVESHEGTWENPRSIGTDQHSVKALESLMQEVTGRVEEFDLLELV